MTVPLYFLPHVERGQIAPGNRLSQDVIRKRGLSHIFGDIEGPQKDCAINALSGRGPEGLPGVILCVQGPSGELPRRIGHYPDEIDWTPWHRPEANLDHPAFFIGLDTASRPTPADLARRETYRGHSVTLGDGHTWEVPILRSPTGGTSLPRSLGWDASGEFSMRVKEAYRAAWDASERSASLFYDAETEGSIDYEEAADLALQALAINYRLGRAEQTVLGLIDTVNWEDVIGASVDLPTVEKVLALEKKSSDSDSTPASPSSKPGDGDGSPTTGPAVASCSSPAVSKTT